MSRIFLSAPDITGRERELVTEVFDSNYIAPTGAMLTKFEEDMCKYTGFAHGVALSSGTAALHLALRIVGVSAGDEVWTTSMTFIGGASPITYLGATPVFFDLSADNWTIDPDLLEVELKRASKEGKLPKAILPTDLYGQSCDLDRITKLCDEYGVMLVIDSAEAVGAFYKGRHAGSGSHCAILSFNGNKMMTTSGGGMLISNDKAIVDKARYLSTQARQPFIHYEHTEIGYNYRLSNVCAAIGVGQLEQIEDKVVKRRAHFDRYVEAFSGTPGIEFMPEPEGYRSTRWLTCLTYSKEMNVTRHDVQAACDAAEIEVRPLWKPMHMQPVFKGAKMIGGAVCEDLFDRGMCLPSGSGMTISEQSRVIDVIKSVINA